MASTKFYIEKRKGIEGDIITKNVPILLSFSFNSNRIWIQTGERIDSNKWDDDKQKVKSSAIKKDDVMSIYRNAIAVGIDHQTSKFKHKPNLDIIVINYFDEIWLRDCMGGFANVKIFKFNYSPNYCTLSKETKYYQYINKLAIYI